MPLRALLKATPSVQKRLLSMAHPKTASRGIQSSPFSRAVFSAMDRLYPDALADKSFDNTGILLESPVTKPSGKPSVLLTIDLTSAVADEAILNSVDVVVSYHPIIFRALKSLTLANSQQTSLLRLAAQGISVYSPHTAVDAAVGGNADWLCDLVVGKYSAKPAELAQDDKRGSFAHGKTGVYAIHSWPSHTAQSQVPASAILTHSRAPVTPNEKYPGAGMGRIVTLEKQTTLKTVLQNLATGLGSPKAFQMGLPQCTSLDDHSSIKNIAVCAGSGGSVVGNSGADVIITGEMSHHEVLAATERGQVVVCLNHSNSERNYLSAVMQPLLHRELETMGASGFEVMVSAQDRDPLEYVVLA